jgi:hypothetical protein
MNKDEHIMATAAEEAVEVAQRITKALRFGLTEVQPGQPFTNAERILEEYHDLHAMMEWMADRGLIPGDLLPSTAKAIRKVQKVEKFMGISREQGVLS